MVRNFFPTLSGDWIHAKEVGFEQEGSTLGSKEVAAKDLPEAVSVRRQWLGTTLQVTSL